MRGSGILFPVVLKLGELFPVFPGREREREKTADPYEDEEQRERGDRTGDTVVANERDRCENQARGCAGDQTDRQIGFAVSLEAATGEKQYIVSFIGFAPADDPKIALLVFLDTPSTETGIYISGGQMAAPLVGKMLADILPYLGVRPSYSEAEKANMDAVMPQTVGKSLGEAGELIRGAGLRYCTLGEGDAVTAQLPAAYCEIARGTEVILYLGAEMSNEKESVPNLIGMRYNDARDTLSRLGIYIHSLSAVLDGENQRVGTQSLAEGTFAAHGSVIEVSLLSADDEMLGRY